jgi:Ser/Thr protein kinase RdoA (MazF antagonist)
VNGGSADDEVVLHGGFTNEGLVSRVGGTVRRPERATSAATRALLEHLERAGFDGAPRHLGHDEQGREVLSFVEGEAPVEPFPAWARTDQALVSVAELLRRYHDAVASFDPSAHRWPRPVPAAYDDGLLCHNDPNLDNVVFSGGRAVALIDFDLAGPGSAVWDVACAARFWAPLRDDRDLPESLQGGSLRRLRLFADAYGLPDGERARLPAAVRAAHTWAYDVVRDALADGHGAFSRFWDGGGRTRAERTARWLEAHEQPMLRALRDPV